MKKGKFIIILALLAVMLLAVGCPPPEEPPADEETKLVCIFFDDGWQNQYNVALPILLFNDFKATFGIITDYIATGYEFHEYMTEEELHELVGYGMEITSHSETHPDLTGDLTNEQLRDEIIGSKQHLEQMGFESRTFVYPFFEYNDEIVGIVKEAGYICARSGGHIQKEPYDLNTTDPDARYYVGSVPIADQSFDEFKTVVDQANGDFVVCLCYHFVSDALEVYTATPVKSFAEQMKYLKENGFTVVILADLIESQ